MDLPDLQTDRPLVDAVIALLAARGPLSYEQVSDALGENPDDGGGRPCCTGRSSMGPTGSWSCSTSV